MTEWEIEQEATKRINYLKTKGGWRGFIEGALWMQKQVLPQANVMRSFCTCTTPQIHEQHDGVMVCLNCLKDMAN